MPQPHLGHIVSDDVINRSLFGQTEKSSREDRIESQELRASHGLAAVAVEFEKVAENVEGESENGFYSI